MPHHVVPPENERSLAVCGSLVYGGLAVVVVSTCRCGLTGNGNASFAPTLLASQPTVQYDKLDLPISRLVPWTSRDCRSRCLRRLQLQFVLASSRLFPCRVRLSLQHDPASPDLSCGRVHFLLLLYWRCTPGFPRQISGQTERRSAIQYQVPPE